MALAGANVPKLDCEVARGRSEDVFGGGVEQDLSDFSIVDVLVNFPFREEKSRGNSTKVSNLPRVTSELADW